jgi:hypothetical protein
LLLAFASTVITGFSHLKIHEEDFYSLLDMHVFRIGASSSTNRLVSSFYNFGTDRIENTASNNSSIFGYFSVAAETCLSCRYLAKDSFF